MILDMLKNNQKLLMHKLKFTDILVIKFVEQNIVLNKGIKSL